MKVAVAPDYILLGKDTVVLDIMNYLIERYFIV